MGKLDNDYTVLERQSLFSAIIINICSGVARVPAARGGA